MLERGEFREDLYYRLNGITLELPPLAARPRQGSARARVHRARIGRHGAASIEKVALEKLLAYDWPGNIRELRNSIRTALALCSGRVIRLGDLPQADSPRKMPRRGHPSWRPRGVAGAPMQCPLENAEREVLLGVIAQHRWNMSQVAAQLGISRNTLYRKIKRHGIVIARRPGGC